MGIWGAGLYDNDCTADIREAFMLLLDAGVQPNKAAETIRKENVDMFRDPEDGPLVELALREQLFLLGALKEKERIETITFLESFEDQFLRQDTDPQLIKERVKELERLSLLFRSSSPKKYKINSGTIRIRNDWKCGQLFAIPITDSAPIEFQGEFILLYICGEAEKLGKYPIPKAYVKITNGKQLPVNPEEFNRLAYVQVSATAMENRFLPFKCEEEVPIEYRQAYFPDEWGYLPEYTIALYEAKGNHPPDSMIYLGCIEDIEPPHYDYQKCIALNGVAWDYLQEFVLRRFCLHNLRQAKYYQT